MKLSEYQTTMQHILVPVGLKDRILEACTQKNRSHVRVPRLAAAAVLVLALMLTFCFSGGRQGMTAAEPFSVRVYAADVQGVDLIGDESFDYGGGDFFILEDGRLERGGTLFFQLGKFDSDGNSKSDIDRIELKAETGVLSCYHQLENAGKNWEDGWETGMIILPRDVYEEAVADLEHPTKEEIRSILTAISAETIGSTEYEDATSLWINAGANGTIRKALLPILDELEISQVRFQTKNEISKVLVDFDNPQSEMREKDVKVKSLSVQCGEEVEWMADVDAVRGKQLSEIDFTAFSDCIELTAYCKDGIRINGEIRIEIAADGTLRAYYEVT